MIDARKLLNSNSHDECSYGCVHKTCEASLSRYGDFGSDLAPSGARSTTCVGWLEKNVRSRCVQRPTQSWGWVHDVVKTAEDRRESLRKTSFVRNGSPSDPTAVPSRYRLVRASLKPCSLSNDTIVLSLGFVSASRDEPGPTMRSLSRFIVGLVARYRSAVLEIFR